MSNIADFILEFYSKKIFPKPLGNQKIEIPEHFHGYAGKHSILKLAKQITLEQEPDKVLKSLQLIAMKSYKFIVQEVEKQRQFPMAKEGETLSMYALRVFGDTHALDSGKPLRSELNTFLKKQFNSYDLTNIGIVKNKIASTVWSKGVIATEGFLGVSLFDVKNIAINELKAVWIFENDNTALRILDSNYSFPFVIASGRPTEAFHILITRLVDKQVKIFYQGDMDKAGIDMADSLKSKYPIIETPLMTTSEFLEVSSKVKGKKQNYHLEHSFSSALRDIVNNTGLSVYEEQIDLSKCQAAYDNYVRRKEQTKKPQ